MVELALRRLRARRGRAAASALAVAAAVGLLLAVAVIGSDARERSARERVAELPAAERVVRISARVLPLMRPEPADPRPAVRDGEEALAALGLGRPATVLVSGPVSPADERGTRVVLAPELRLVSGRMPRGAGEVVALGRQPAVGDRVELGRVRARVVGRATLPPELTPSEAVLHGRAVAIGEERFVAATRDASLWVVTTAALRPATVRGDELAALARRMRAAAARAERSGDAVTVTTPAARLEAIDRRGRTAQRRLLLVGAQGAALFLAFAALLGVARRRDAAALAAQLSALGGTRAQTAFVRLVETVVPVALGTAVALAAGAVAAWVAGVGLPAEVFALVAAVAIGAVVAEHLAARPARERGFGTLEVAALACLAAVVWQALATGGLDAAQVSPSLLLVPVLALFAGGVVVARALPFAFRLAERSARRRGVATRLALLSLTRGGGLAAAATTFLALSLGGALFALDYRATLANQLDAQAAFAAGTSWRVFAPEGVVPLTRFGGGEEPRPAIRVPALVSPGVRFEDAREATLLALRGDVPRTQGWEPVAGVATGLRPDGPRLDGTRLRTWVRSTLAVTMVLEVLLPGESFARLELGFVPDRRWVRLQARIPRRLRGGVIVGLTPSSLLIPRAAVMDIAPLEQRTAAGWATLDDLREWEVLTGRFGVDGRVVAGTYDHAPVSEAVIVDVPESDAPLIRPGYELPRALPAVVSRSLAATAFDGRLTAMVEGRPLPLQVVGTSERLPTVTSRPDRFVLVDYDTLLAVVTAQRPGALVANEAWFDGPSPVGRPSFPDATVVSRERAIAAARGDALAGGAVTVLAVMAILAAALAAAGLLLAAGGLRRAEREELAGWRALGAGPATLARMSRVRVLALCAAGTVAAVIGAALALRLVVALVAVTASGGEPLPPIEPRVDWPASAALIATTAAVAVAAVRARR